MAGTKVTDFPTPSYTANWKVPIFYTPEAEKGTPSRRSLPVYSIIASQKSEFGILKFPVCSQTKFYKNMYQYLLKFQLPNRKVALYIIFQRWKHLGKPFL